MILIALLKIYFFSRAAVLVGGGKIFLKIGTGYFCFELIKIINYFIHLGFDIWQIICSKVPKLFRFSRRRIHRVVWFGIFYFCGRVDIKICDGKG